MTQRTAAVSSDVGAPFELISEKPPPITSATKARMPQISEPLRALLQKKRDRDRSGFEPLEAVLPPGHVVPTAPAAASPLSKCSRMAVQRPGDRA